MAHEDALAGFTLDGAPARGRIARLGASTIDAILKRHAYPPAAARLLGEAITLAALVGALLKVEGSLTVQAEGDGPVPLLVAEHRTGGALRGYARVTSDIGAGRLAPADLIGAGALTLTLDQGPDTSPMQGIVPLDGPTLAACAEHYFDISEQTPTRIRLAVGEEITGEGASWRAGGALIQRVAGDEARGFTEEDWSRATILFESVTDAELLDPVLPLDRLLYRLFHEDGVRMTDPAKLADRCTCDAGRLTALMRRFSPEELEGLAEDDGMVHARCQFCSRLYLISPADLRT